MVNAPHTTTNPDTTPATSLGHRRVIAAIHSPATLAAARVLPPLPAAPDWLELRVDGFVDGDSLGELEAFAAQSVRPLIVTVRHPAEGGAVGAPADVRSRERLYERSLAFENVVAADVEVRSLRALGSTVRKVLEEKRQLVASYHDFTGTPGGAKLRELARRSTDAGATVIKLAATVNGPGDLARLLDFLEWGRGSGLKMAVMGMGPLGRVARLALAAAGSVLNYGYLGQSAQVAGQWPVETLRARIAECVV